MTLLYDLSSQLQSPQQTGSGALQLCATVCVWYCSAAFSWQHLSTEEHCMLHIGKTIQTVHDQRRCYTLVVDDTYQQAMSLL